MSRNKDKNKTETDKLFIMKGKMRPDIARAYKFGIGVGKEQSQTQTHLADLREELLLLSADFPASIDDKILDLVNKRTTKIQKEIKEIENE